MAEAFRSFAALLLGRDEANAEPPGPPESEPAVITEPCRETDPRVADLLAGFTVELNRLTARAAELLEEQAEAALADLARRVLGREFASSPAEIAALLAETLAEFGVTRPLAVRVSSADAQHVVSPWRVQIDPSLSAGDFAVDVEDGSYDLNVQTRLDALLAAHRIAL
ncbi:MAG: FliH/SctL family protein [Candidatus Velthaea sp.]|jgi:flagellar biosynthesis/type III secretory pathway protein FliH